MTTKRELHIVTRAVGDLDPQLFEAFVEGTLIEGPFDEGEPVRGYGAGRSEGRAILLALDHAGVLSIYRGDAEMGPTDRSGPRDWRP